MYRAVGKRGNKRPWPETVRSGWSIQEEGKMVEAEATSRLHRGVCRSLAELPEEA